jgi:enamine deaminase RidA (YjgF/YER057c/UK114 family)
MERSFNMTTNAATAEARLAQLGIQLPDAPTPLGAYVPAVQTGNLLYLSGMLAIVGHKATQAGVVGRNLGVNAGRAAPTTAALNAVALIRKQLGSLDRVKRVVRLGVYVVATPESRSTRKSPTPPLSCSVICLARTQSRRASSSVSQVCRLVQRSNWK